MYDTGHYQHGGVACIYTSDYRHVLIASRAFALVLFGCLLCLGANCGFAAFNCDAAAGGSGQRAGPAPFNCDAAAVESGQRTGPAPPGSFTGARAFESRCYGAMAGCLWQSLGCRLVPAGIGPDGCVWALKFVVVTYPPAGYSNPQCNFMHRARAPLLARPRPSVRLSILGTKPAT